MFVSSAKVEKQAPSILIGKSAKLRGDEIKMEIDTNQVSRVGVTSFNKDGSEKDQFDWLVHCGVETAMDQFKKGFNLTKEWDFSCKHLHQMCTFDTFDGSMIVYIIKMDIHSISTAVNAYR